MIAFKRLNCFELDALYTKYSAWSPIISPHQIAEWNPLGHHVTQLWNFMLLGYGLAVCSHSSHWYFPSVF